MADHIRVEPGSIRKYGTEAQLRFNNIRTTLTSILDDSINVDYYGTNAAQFKTQLSTMVTDYSTAVLKDLSAIAEAVRASTTNIVKSLGGSPISIEVNGSPIEAKISTQDGDAQGGSMAALGILSDALSGLFDHINAELNEHLRELRATDWVGDAKDSAVGAVTKYTTQATTETSTAKSSVTKYIHDQITATQTADQ